jgi:signal transduction histidine kinase
VVENLVRTARLPRAPFRRPPAPGEAVRHLEGCGRTYASAIRMLTWVPLAVVGLIATWGTGQMPAVVTAIALASGWHAVFCLLVRRSSGIWLAVADTAVLVTLSLCSVALVPPQWVAVGRSWIIPFVSFAGVAMQYWSRPVTGAVAGGALAAAMTAGTRWALPPGASSPSLVSAVWVLVLCALGRILWMLVTRAGRKADEIAAQLEASSRAQQVAAAVRADRRALDDALHDTANSTLLMVGLGQPGSDIELLRKQARKDVEGLTSFGERPPERVELVALLDESISIMPLPVTRTGPDEVWLPGTVALAMADATGEALVNIVKHACAGSVEIDVSDGPGGVCVAVIDDGIGFDVGAVPDHRYGVRRSLHGRMADIGGRADVTSRPGAGTTVRLEWTRD